MNFREGDVPVDIGVLPREVGDGGSDGQSLLVLTSKGFGKRVDTDEFKLTRRCVVICGSVCEICTPQTTQTLEKIQETHGVGLGLDGGCAAWNWLGTRSDRETCVYLLVILIRTIYINAARMLGSFLIT